MAVWLPPVNIPQIGGHNYAAELNAGLSNIGEAVYRNRRDVVEDDQWSQNYARALAGDQLAAEQWEKGYARDLAADELAQQQFGLEVSEFEAEQAAEAAGMSDRFGTLIYEEGPDGSMVASQLQKGGDPIPLPNKNLVFPGTFLNTGTSFEGYDRYGRPRGTTVPIDVEGTSAAREAGGIQGAAQGILPQARIQIDYVSQKIKEVMSDPDLGLVTGGGGAGGFGGLLPTWMSVSAKTRDKGREAQSRLQFVKDQVFPLAYDLIRGAGPIAIYESQAAARALSRLDDQALSDTGYIEALADFDVKIKLLLKAIEAKAGGAGDGQSGGQPQGQPLVVSPDGFEAYPGEQ